MLGTPFAIEEANATYEGVFTFAQSRLFGRAFVGFEIRPDPNSKWLVRVGSDTYAFSEIEYVDFVKNTALPARATSRRGVKRELRTPGGRGCRPRRESREPTAQSGRDRKSRMSPNASSSAT